MNKPTEGQKGIEFRLINCGGIGKMAVVQPFQKKESKVWSRVTQEWVALREDDTTQRRKYQRAMKQRASGTASLVGFSTTLYEQSKNPTGEKFTPKQGTKSGYPKCFADFTYITSNKDPYFVPGLYFCVLLRHSWLAQGQTGQIHRKI